MNETEQKTQPKKLWTRTDRRKLGAQRRAKQNYGVGGMFSRVPSGVPTGRPKWFTEMQRDVLARKHLRKAPTVALDAVSDRLGNSLRESGVTSVYGLATAVYVDLLRVTGLGPATLRKIRAELIRRDVPVKWEVPV